MFTEFKKVVLNGNLIVQCIIWWKTGGYKISQGNHLKAAKKMEKRILSQRRGIIAPQRWQLLLLDYFTLILKKYTTWQLQQSR